MTVLLRDEIAEEYKTALAERKKRHQELDAIKRIQRSKGSLPSS